MKLKRILPWFVGLNLFLVAVCGYLYSERPDHALLPPQLDLQSTAQSVSAESNAVPASVQTLQNVAIDSAVGEYEQKQHEIPTQSAAVRDRSDRPLERQTFGNQPREQEVLVGSNSSFGAIASSATVSDGIQPVDSSSTTATVLPVSAQPANEAKSAKQSVGAVSYPLVMSPPDPAIPLTEQQSADWQKLQQDFTDAVGGLNQNPNDPAYRTRWITAQDYSDEMFKLKFGETAFLLQSFAAARQGGNQ
jgi:hypothetical protein